MPTCQLCSVPFPNHIIRDGKKHNLQRRKYCPECSPFGRHNTKQLHGGHKHRNRSGHQHGRYVCVVCGRVTRARRKRCDSCNTKIRRIRAKKAAVRLLGGKCVRCGWSEFLEGFDFHHRDPKMKDIEITRIMNKSWSAIKVELAKCDLLCALCHRKVHSNRTDSVLIAEANRYRGKGFGLVAEMD